MPDLDSLVETLYNHFQRKQLTRAKSEIDQKHNRSKSAITRPLRSQSSQNFLRFQMLNIIGTGAFSQVWRAFDKLTNRNVAIKKYHVHTINQEADMIRSLDHENIVRYVTQYQGDLVMEIIEGQTLSKLMKYKKLSQNEVSIIMAQLKTCIQECHVRGIAHRDIKPANIMITDRYQVILVDFGLASKSLSLNDFSGTPAYMAPEILAKKNYNPKQADLWALGVVQSQMVNGGRLPFKGKTNEEIRVQQSQFKSKSSLLRMDPKLRKL